MARPLGGGAALGARGGAGVTQGRHFSFFVDHLRSGGVAKMRLTIAGALAKRGHKVDMVMCEPGGAFTERLSGDVRVIPLERSSWARARACALASDPGGLLPLLAFALAPVRTSPTLSYLPALIDYLRRERPYALYAATTFIAVEASLAVRRAAVPTRLVLSEHVNLAPGLAVVSGWNRLYLRPLVYRAYMRADAAFGVSDGVCDTFAEVTGVPRDRIVTIHNPTVTPELRQEAREPVDHPWFGEGQPPVVLGAGRLTRSKDFATLVRAVARVRRERPVRLMILGEGKSPRKTEKITRSLEALAAELGIADDVALMGFAINPYKYMSKAAVYVLSSRWEGLPNTLIEAMACGCPVVSTDTPSGPAEILKNGEVGPLVPIGDDAAMAAAIASILAAPPDRERVLARAADFTVERAVERYEAAALAPEDRDA